MAQLPSLIPQNLTDQQNKLADHVSTLTKIRAYCIGVEQTSLQNIISPVPDWFTTLNTNVQLAKTHATVWTANDTGIEAQITSTIPQAAITFGSRFGTGSTAILNILVNSNYSPSAAEIDQIQHALTWMNAGVSAQQANVDAIKGEFGSFQTNAAADLTNLTTGNNSIQAALNIDNKVITQLNGDIATQNANIAADNAAITAAALAGGIGLFVGVAMVGLGAASTGPAAPIVIAIGAFIMVGSIVEMAAVIAVYSQKLAAAQSKLADDTYELGQENQQVASLTVMNTSVTTLVTLNKDMAQSLSDIADWWAIISKDIAGVAADFTAISKDMTSADWYGMWLDMTQAKADWANFVLFATQMEVTVTTIQNKVIPINSTINIAAA